MSDTGIAGHSGRALWQKRGLRPGRRILALDPPRDDPQRVGLPPGQLFLVGPHDAFDPVHLFVCRRSQLETATRKLSARLPPNGLPRGSWPKQLRA